MLDTMQGGARVTEGTPRLGERTGTKVDMKEDLGKASWGAGHSSTRREPGQKHRMGKFISNAGMVRNLAGLNSNL